MRCQPDIQVEMVSREPDINFKGEGRLEIDIWEWPRHGEFFKRDEPG